ncbi:MAG TPA: hypothetical protein VHB50_14670 [Bryobacteraceae bacterium]|nr:hypothetical protein [Bryobacteraceae bacterium]
MRAACFPRHSIILLLSASGLCPAAGTYPTYSAQSIVHAATQTAEALAPNTIATIYGQNLSFVTDSAGPSNLNGPALPQTLDGVSVIVGGLLANLYFVSPTQINFLVPYELTAGITTLAVVRQGAAGPVVKIQLANTAPGLFQWNGNYAIATHLNGALVSDAAPAVPDEIIVIFAAGLGHTTPDTTSGRIVASAATIAAASQMRIMLAGNPCPPLNVLYAGLTPGFAGLYQINLKLPSDLPPDPEIRIAFGPQISPASIQLAVR